MGRQEDTKRSLELAIFRRLQEVDPTLPRAEPYARDKPDVRVPTPAGVIGVEVTRLFFQRPRSKRPTQEQDSLRVQLAELAKLYFANTGMPARVARPVFRPLVVLDKRHLRADALAFATAVAMADIQSTESRRYTSTQVPELPECVAAFHGRLCYPNEDARWLNGIGGLVHQVRPEHIASKIAEKEAKLDEYDKSLIEQWLVVALHGWTSAALAELQDETRDARYPTHFQRVYFFDSLRGLSVQLQVTPR
jgi:hypothetical protein